MIKKLIISVKARNKFQKNNTLNSAYKIGKNAYANAELAKEQYKGEPYWMAIQFDQLTFSIYFGALEELKGKNAISIRKCEEEIIGQCLVKDKRHYFDFDFFINEKKSLLRSG